MSFESKISATPSVQADDERIKITRWDFAPGAATGWHTHEWPYTIVMLTDAKMRLHNGTLVSEVSLKAGDSYKRPAGVSHDVQNGSDAPMSFVEIEFKPDANSNL